MMPTRRCTGSMKAMRRRRSKSRSPAPPATARSIARRSAQRVAGDAQALRFLESIVHPLVGEVRDRFLADAKASGATVVVLDIPLLYETGGENRVDAVVVVSAPAEVQRARMRERGVPPERLEALLARQMPDAEKRRRADFVVDTGHGIEAARGQVRAILAAVAKMPSKRN